MTDLTDIKAPPAAMAYEATGLPDPDLVYANYLKNCHRRGVTPVSRDHARDLMGNWFDVLGRVMTQN